jgi:hypothetical protein
MRTLVKFDLICLMLRQAKMMTSLRDDPLIVYLSVFAFVVSVALNGVREEPVLLGALVRVVLTPDGQQHMLYYGHFSKKLDSSPITITVKMSSFKFQSS